MSELDQIEARLKAATPGAVTITPTDIAYLLTLARKQASALEAVQALADEWARELDNPDHLIYLEDALEATRSALGRS